MNQEQVLAWAREAGGDPLNSTGEPICFRSENLERFAALVAAHEREKATEYRLKLENVLAGCEAAVLAEREACAQFLESDLMSFASSAECAAAIRARGDK